MATLRIVNSDVTIITGPIQQVLSGTVTKNGAPAIRNILIYSDKGLTTLLQNTVSNAAGEWTATVPGGGSSKFTVIAIGNIGENNIIYASCPSTYGGYSAPSLDAINFEMSLNSGVNFIYGALSEPLSDIASDINVTSWCYGDCVEPLSSIAGEVINTIMINGDCVEPLSSISGIVQAVERVWGNLHEPLGVISGEVEITNLINGSLAEKISSLDGVATVTIMVNGNLNEPLSVIDSFIEEEDTIAGNLMEPTSSIYGDISLTSYVYGNLSEPFGDVDGDFTLPLDDTVLKYKRYPCMA